MARCNFFNTVFPVMLLAAATTACAAPHDGNANSGGTTTRSPLSRDDRVFVAKAKQGGMAEVEAAKLAEQKSQVPKIKEFGARMVQDHGRANRQLERIASEKGIAVPDKLDKSGERELDVLEKLSGVKFERAYTEREVSDHKKAIKEFEHEAASGSDQDLKRFAEDTLPTLREHLQLAEAAQKAAKSEGK